MVPVIKNFTLTRNRYPKSVTPPVSGTGDYRYLSAQRTHMEVAFEQGGVNDLQELLLRLDGRSAFHEWGGTRLVIRVIQLLYQLASFLQRPNMWDQGQY